MDFPAFLRSATAVTAARLCPELRLHLAGDLAHLWHAQESWLQRRGVPAPFWGVAWLGGEGLARYVLDHPELVGGRSVLDLGAGSGLCAIAAAKAGAASVEAADLDAYALEAIAANAALNGVRITTIQEDLIGAAPRWDVILAADLWYERFLAQRVTGWLRETARGGTTVLLGDTGRAFFPKGATREVARYAIGVPESLERAAAGTTKVLLFCIPPLPGKHA